MKYFLVIIFIFSVVLLSQITYASTGAPTIPVELKNPLRVGSINELLVAILNIVMVLMVPVIVFYIILAGLKYVTARGNATKVQEATMALTYAVIGGVIILASVAISQIIKNTVDEFRPDDTTPSGLRS